MKGGLRRDVDFCGSGFGIKFVSEKNILEVDLSKSRIYFLVR